MFLLRITAYFIGSIWFGYVLVICNGKAVSSWFMMIILYYAIRNFVPDMKVSFSPALSHKHCNIHLTDTHLIMFLLQHHLIWFLDRNRQTLSCFGALLLLQSGSHLKVHCGPRAFTSIHVSVELSLKNYKAQLTACGSHSTSRLQTHTDTV